ADLALRRIAAGTAGFSGADLANVLNEAALLAARRTAKEIAQRDLEEAIEKVVAGPERKSRRLNEEEKRRVAYHEVGHALVAAYSPHADPVHKISIVPRGRAALGYTMQLPAENQFLPTRGELLDRILDRCYLEAKEILNLHRDQHEQITAELLRHETIDGARFYQLIGREMPRPKEPVPPLEVAVATAPNITERRP